MRISIVELLEHDFVEESKEKWKTTEENEAGKWLGIKF